MYGHRTTRIGPVPLGREFFPVANARPACPEPRRVPGATQSRRDVRPFNAASNGGLRKFEESSTQFLIETPKRLKIAATKTKLITEVASNRVRIAPFFKGLLSRPLQVPGGEVGRLPFAPPGDPNSLGTCDHLAVDLESEMTWSLLKCGRGLSCLRSKSFDL
jgi:hypothetical protein